MLFRVFTLALCAAALLPAIDINSLKPQGYVSDFAGVLDAGTRQQIDAYCGSVEESTGAQISVVTLKSLDGEPVEDFTNDLFRKWGVGHKGKDDGIMLLLAIQDRKSRVEVGYGLEPDLPDGFAGSILRQIRPPLQSGNYGEAILEGVKTMGTRIASSRGVALQDQSPVRQRPPVRQREGLPWPLIVIGIFFLFWIFGRGGRGGPSGCSFLPWFILGNVLGRSGGGGGGWGGGGFGSGGGGGGGFGGFGGGDSGGGGASGSW